ncbi:MAG: hypothetical protein OXN23_04620 [Gammaproteobacteria bacterium]|nr:hypothetical protein [Gammaproteobacteria bacterium]
MTFAVQRKCREIREGESSSLPQYLGDFKEIPAYVLLGEPGAGKTTAFKQEAGSEETCCFIPARDFLDFDKDSEWMGKTLFIDGLDEIPAGDAGPQTPLGIIRGKLHRLGTPKFRLSCRAADWLGPSDRNALDTLLPNNEKILVLRLEPLSLEDVREVLKKRLNVADPEAFIESANQKELEYLLDNPQNLEMLALAVAQLGGQWPEDRERAFDLACEKLLEEGNPDRKSRRQRSSSVPDLLMAAGKLFAIQILTGCAGYSLDNDENSDTYLPPNRVPHRNRSEFRDVFDSRLFRVPQENRAEPYHRHVAEFLGAKYLAKLIKEGLPVGRILILTTGFGGGIVSEFRGLLAWLATHSLVSREKLLELDPYGVIAYGHIRNFSVNQKTRLLDALKREAEANPWFANAFSYDHSWEGFATPDMKEELLKYFSVSEPDDSQQSLALICLQALNSGVGISGMSDFALGILKNPLWGLLARRVALDLFIRQIEDNEERANILMELLKATETGEIFDPGDDLCGCLLEATYPQALSPSEVVRYLRPPKRANYFGSYCRFWIHTVARKSTGEQLGELLDFLVKLFDQSPEEFSQNFDQFNHLRNLPERWLECYLENFADAPDPYRLLCWLELIRASRGGPSYRKIGEWLSEHPETLLDIYGLGVRQCEELEKESEETNLCMHYARERLASARMPQNFGAWCLERAIATKHPEIAKHLVRWTANCVHNSYYDAGLSLKVVKSRLSTKPSLFKVYMEYQEGASSNDAETKQHREKYDTEILERQQEWHTQLNSMKEDLLANRCRRDVLYELAVVYYGGYGDVSGDTPKERLESLLGKDESLIEEVLQAFRMSINREDLPSVEEIFRLEANNMTPLLAYPYMAGLNEVSETSQDRSLSISEERMRLALAFYYTVPLWPLPPRTGDETPQWFPSLLQSRPDMVSDILVAATRKKLRRSSDFIKGLYELAHSQDYEKVARMASLPLLKAFPVRCSQQRLQDLNHLLTAAVLHCEKEALLNIVEEKLSSRTMQVGQRVRWLAAGLFVAPEQYQDRLESYVAGKEPRIRALAEIMTSRFLDALPDSPSIPVLSLLIRLLGSSYGPHYYNTDDSSMEGCLVTLGMDAAHSVRFFCEQLSQTWSHEATESLELLLANEQLRAWHPNLTDLAYKQKILRRDNNFEHHAVEEVFRILENARPENPADLATVAMMKLEEIARDIQDGNTSDWRAFWTSEKNDHAPQHEDFCRDRLLSKLRPLLTPLDIDAQPEGRYANEKRSDIRLFCDGFNVPIEIKKSMHPDLWTAIRSQLIAKYTRDPGADGNGIYLALWFREEDCKATESGNRPKNANELKQRLPETLSEEEKSKIQIFVIDVSRQS